MHNFTHDQTKELAKQIELDNQKEIIVPKKLTKPHHLVSDAKYYFSVHKKLSHWDPKTVSLGEENLSIHVTKPLLTRSFIWINSLIKLGIARGHSISTEKYKTIIEIKGVPMEVHLREKNKANYDNKKNWYDTRTLEPTGILCFSYYHIYTQKEWYDAKTVKLEDKLAVIMAFLELKAQEEIESKIRAEEFHRKWEEEKALKAKQELLKQQEIVKYNDLVQRAERWDQYTKITSYLSMIEDQNLESKEWLNWAKQKAKWIDPRTDTSDEILGQYPIQE